VRFADQFFFRESADFQEIPIDVGDAALEVGLADDDLVFAESPFDAGEVRAMQSAPTFSKACPMWGLA
jgi:hypothetical protein